MIRGKRSLNLISQTNAKELTSQKLRAFGLILAGMIGGVFGLILPFLRGSSYPFWPWATATLFLIPSCTIPSSLKPVYAIWIKLGLILGWVNSRIILGLFFFIVLLPVGLVFRLMGRDSLGIRRPMSEKSYRILSKTYSKRKMEVPY